MSIKKLQTQLEAEANNYVTKYGLDDTEKQELLFIVNSFVKYYNNANSKGKSLSKILREFKDSVDVLISGVFGRDFSSDAVNIFEKLPSIKEMYQKSVKELEKEIEELNIQNGELKAEIEELNKLKNKLEKQKEAYKKKAEAQSNSGYSGGYGNYNSNSYGGCGGGVSYRGYGSC